MFTVSHWHNGEHDCVPPEPGKRWLSILDDDGEEFCVVVHRDLPDGSLLSPKEHERLAFTKEARAYTIANALNGCFGNGPAR